MLASKEKEGKEAELLLTAEGRVEEGMVGWKDVCVQGSSEACEHRDEKEAETF